MSTIIRLHVLSNDIHGSSYAEIDNWNGRVWSLPREDLNQTHERDGNIDKPGVYLLVDGANTFGRKIRVYVGESDNVHRRLYNHNIVQKSLPGWTRCIAITSVNDFLHKGHVQHLESLFVKHFSEDSHFIELANKQKPADNGLSPFERESVKQFFEKSLFALKAMGISGSPATPNKPELSDTGWQTSSPTDHNSGSAHNFNQNDSSEFLNDLLFSDRPLRLNGKSISIHRAVVISGRRGPERMDLTRQLASIGVKIIEADRKMGTVILAISPKLLHQTNTGVFQTWKNLRTLRESIKSESVGEGKTMRFEQAGTHRSYTLDISSFF